MSAPSTNSAPASPDQPQPSIGSKATHGAALSVAFALTARAVGVIGTLAMTHFIMPEVMGEVSAATIIVMIFNWISTFGVGQYTIIKGRGAEAVEVTWHCTFLNVILGGTAMLIAAAIGGYVLPWFNTAGGAAFVPGMALAFGLRRIAAIPEKVLMREFRFRPIGVAMTIGEASYAGTSVYLAWLGYGGMAVVYGNIVQSSLILILIVSAAGLRSWLTPTRLSAARLRDIWRFGAPLAVESIAHNSSRYGDNLLMARYFGPGPMAFYNLGYNLADIPASYVGEQVGSVLLPSFAQLPLERQPAALPRAAGLLALVIFPMGVGLAVVANPLVATILAPEWVGSPGTELEFAL